ncbi:MAG TPA: hypothetical protein PKE39_11225 [Ignavibacteria bacterium]|nr:hypothetical protein [Ignavibacteria bacterium]HMQ99584.1 hypothetical protein [Ignavibacteria bacterium]
MNPSKKLLFALFFICAVSVYADPVKVYIEYEHSNKNSANKMVFKLYKDGDKYKLVRKLSDSPDETGIVTTYIDITERTVVSVTEKDGVKKGLRSAWDDDYVSLFLQYPVFFRGIPPGKAYMSYKKVEGTETVNGKDCDVYQGPVSILQQSSKYYLWDRIMLRSTAPGYETVSTLINEDPAFTADEFTVPADVQF